MPPPFMTLATQKPVEQEGTYPLPEAQLDRFMVKLGVMPHGLSPLVGEMPGRAEGGELARQPRSSQYGASHLPMPT